MENLIFLKRLYKKLALVYALNLTDWVFTLLLLRTGQFAEANPVMQPFITSIPQGFTLKCLFPAAAIGTVMLLLRRLRLSELGTADRFISFVLVFYLAINLDHIVNFFLLIFREFQILT